MTDISPTPQVQTIQTEIETRGFAVVPAAQTRHLLGDLKAADINAFCASWNDLMVDHYMADGGRYRRRRHAVFDLNGPVLARLAGQPHYQSPDYNPLNGGIERWFEPVTSAVEHSPVLAAIFELCREAFQLHAGQSYRCELHQFRIEATADAAGQPTPEGMHRDGVDWVGVILIDRVNLAEGTTSIAGPGRVSLGTFTLTQPFDAVFLDDHRVMHGVTAVRPIDPSVAGHRDVLILTFRRDQTARR